MYFSGLPALQRCDSLKNKKGMYFSDLMARQL